MPRLAGVLLVAGLLLASLPPLRAGENREQMVKGDKTKMEDDESWIYNDPAKAFEEAKKSGKPMMVVMRCIPCHACKIVDEDVAARNEVLKDLMDKFVCLRIVQGNNLDLTLMQFDYDMSWAVVFMNADKTVYARFGTKFEQKNGDAKASLQGLKKSMEAVLACHKAYPGNKAALEGKQPKETKIARPEQYPKLKDYAPNLDYQGNVVKSCLHCHMIRDAEREFTRANMPEQVLYPYPMPETLGMNLDPAGVATVASVTPGSAAEKAGLKAGDEVTALGGQPVYSIADVAWMLHHFKDGDLKAEVRRGDKTEALTLALAPGWKKESDLSWRVSTWNMRRMSLGGMLLETLPDDERKKLGIADGKLALRAKHVGQYGEHALAKNAGLVKGDVIVGMAGMSDAMTESQLIGKIMTDRKPGETVQVSVLRGGEKKEFSFKLP